MQTLQCPSLSSPFSAGGTNDGPRLVAYDKASGKEIASADLPGVAIGRPMTYKLGDKQYIALTVSGRRAKCRRSWR